MPLDPGLINRFHLPQGRLTALYTARPFALGLAAVAAKLAPPLSGLQP